MSFVKLEDQLGKSGPFRLNFLWKDEGRPIYIMDNHLGALACWLCELAPEAEYSLVHVDWHWDDAAPDNLERLKAAQGGGFDALLALNTVSGMGSFPSVRWDNYLSPLPDLRPNARAAFLLAHQIETGNAPLGFPEIESYRSPDAIAHLHVFLHNATGRILINFDLDYFFLSLGDNNIMRAFTDEFVAALVRRIATSAPDAIWTIAWSPDCCAGWESSAALCEVVCAALGVECPAVELRKRGFPQD